MLNIVPTDAFNLASWPSSHAAWSCLSMVVNSSSNSASFLATAGGRSGPWYPPAGTSAIGYVSGNGMSGPVNAMPPVIGSRTSSLPWWSSANRK
jgi:hypothetical protein